MNLFFNNLAIKNVFHSSKEMFALIHEFNVYPATYVHPTWIEDLIPCALFNTLKNSKRGIRRLSKILLARYHLSQDICYDFDNPWHRFALIPSKVLSKLTLYCGLAFQHKAIATMVGKSSRARIKERIGERAYLFAVKRAPLLLGQAVDIDVSWDGQTDLDLFAKEWGVVFFLSHFKTAPTALVQRLVLKFPKYMTEQSTFDQSDEKGWLLFKRILIHEIDPQWRQLFS